MGKDSSIQWTDHTFNPWHGCVEVSPGCANCYARTQSLRNPAVLGRWGREDKGTRVVKAEAGWREPLKWDREAKAAGERWRVFCASIADVFEDWQGPMLDAKGRVLHYNSAATWWVPEKTMHGPITMQFVRERLFSLVQQTPNLDWLVLTKRPQNIAPMLKAITDTVEGLKRNLLGIMPLPNLWLGTTVENQEQADLRIPHLVKIPAAVRFLSAEPLLGPINLKANTIRPDGQVYPRVVPDTWSSGMIYGIHWLIVGGESGGKARPFDLAWARSLRDQCKAAGAAYFLKQLGARPVFSDHVPGALQGSVEPGSVIGFPTNDSHGGDWDEWPEDLRVREFPVAVGEESIS